MLSVLRVPCQRSGSSFPGFLFRQPWLLGQLGAAPCGGRRSDRGLRSGRVAPLIVLVQSGRLPRVCRVSSMLDVLRSMCIIFRIEYLAGYLRAGSGALF
ncbi:hypothetical protein NDU88_007405 [Pleurodeles waltl]|uniref:Uncharacterized protein n=1 Tax=Pleurodeles waltl TaxID=8319 RepID=A0AAV7QMX3_PLEWA|nr:hypothetical protein NDU88_007405 [Pleurodeles waltl]